MPPVIIPVASGVTVKKVLVATDFSYASAHLIGIAAALGRHFGCTLNLVHVRLDASRLPDPALAPRSAERIQNEARERMGGLLRSPELDGLDVHGRLLVGDPATRLLELAEAEKPDLMVVGTHGTRGIKHVLLGSVAEEVFRHARCPVLTIGPKIHPRFERERQLQTVLVPFDLSPESRSAVPYAASVAAEFKACMRFIHVLPAEARREPQTSELMGQIKREIARQVNFDVPPSCHPEIMLDFGDEAAAIAAAAHEVKADLIVMGLHHRSTNGGLRSSTTYRTILDADCPVLTVRIG